MSHQMLHKNLQYFVTSVPDEPPTYTCSGNFGAPIAGYGIGLPLSRLYMRQLFHGDLQVCPMDGYGTDVFVTFDKFGRGFV